MGGVGGGRLVLGYRIRLEFSALIFFSKKSWDFRVFFSKKRNKVSVKEKNFSNSFLKKREKQNFFSWAEHDVQWSPLTAAHE